MPPEASSTPGYVNEELKNFFSEPLAVRDPALKASIDDELGRQQNQIELIASENIVSRASVGLLEPVIMMEAIRATSMPMTDRVKIKVP